MAEEFDVCVSYSRIDRDYVSRVVASLGERAWKVYFDVDLETRNVGKNLPEELVDAYRNAKRCCVVFISEAYVQSKWTRLELRSANERGVREDQYVVPVRLDDAEASGLLPGTIWIEGRERAPERVADAIHERLTNTRPQRRWIRDTRDYVRNHHWRIAMALALVIALAAYWIWLNRPSHTTVRFDHATDTIIVTVHNSGARPSELTAARLRFDGQPLANTELRMLKGDNKSIGPADKQREFLPSALELRPTVHFENKQDFVNALKGTVTLELDIHESNATASEPVSQPISVNDLRPFIARWVPDAP